MSNLMSNPQFADFKIKDRNRIQWLRPFPSEMLTEYCDLSSVLYKLQRLYYIDTPDCSPLIFAAEYSQFHPGCATNAVLLTKFSF